MWLWYLHDVACSYASSVKFQVQVPLWAFGLVSVSSSTKEKVKVKTALYMDKARNKKEQGQRGIRLWKVIVVFHFRLESGA
jgi:hypothetical protein